jgi:DNA-binding transcriptional ArsR family regulator
MNEDEQLDATFSALANPARRAILARLAEGAATVNTLAEPLDMTLPAVSKHIRVLEDAGLITRGRDAQFRPCALNVEPLQIIVDWTDQYRGIWDARFNAIDNVLKTMRETNDE